MKRKFKPLDKIKDKISNRNLRVRMRKIGLKVYKSKRKAMRKAKRITRKERQVYWVSAEAIGYYVINTTDVRQLNKANMKRKGGKKITTRTLDKECVWRSPNYDTL